MHDPQLAAEALAQLPPDIGQSPLFNPDLAPVPEKRRNWTTYNFAALWISMAHCIPTYLMAGGLLTAGFNLTESLLAIGLGTLIVLVPILLNAHPGTAYGIPFPVLARASFGTQGANLPAVLRGLVACGWFGINAWVGGEAIHTFICTFAPSFANSHELMPGLHVSNLITFLAFWGLNMLIVYRGMDAVRVLENWAAPIVLVLAAVLLWWVVDRAGGVGPVLTKPSQFATSSERWAKLLPKITAVVGFWSTLALNIPDFTRYGRGQREQILGQSLGLPSTMVAFSAMALVITSASAAILKGVPLEKLAQPDVLIGHLTSSSAPEGLAQPLIASAGVRTAVAIISVLGIVLATVSVNIAANVVSPANDFANVAPKYISFKTGGLITGVLGILCMPWRLMNEMMGWLDGVGALLGPVAAIMIVDYFVVRKKQLNVADLYRPGGRYAGWNPIAVVALLVGIAPNFPGFLHYVKVVSHVPSVFTAIYGYAWFVGFALAAVTYVVGCRIRPVKV